MKKQYFVLIALLSITLQAQIVNSLDASFKFELLNYSPFIDANGDNEMYNGS